MGALVVDISKYEALEAPVLVRFRSILDYLEDREPEIVRDVAIVKRGLSRWRRLKALVESLGPEMEGPLEAASFKAAVVYEYSTPVAELYFSDEPRIPRMPRWVRLRVGDVVLYARISNKRDYVHILREAVKAVVVKLPEGVKAKL